MKRQQAPESVEACAERLWATREALGLTQAAISKATGIPPNTWNNAETGDNKLGLENALRLCRTYGLSTDWLYRGDMRLLSADLAAKISANLADLRDQRPARRA